MGHYRFQLDSFCTSLTGEWVIFEQEISKADGAQRQAVPLRTGGLRGGGAAFRAVRPGCGRRCRAAPAHNQLGVLGQAAPASAPAI